MSTKSLPEPDPGCGSTVNPFGVTSRESPQWFSGLSGVAAAMFLARQTAPGKVILVVSPTAAQSEKLSADTATWLKADSIPVIRFVPDRETVYDQTPVSREVLFDRIRARAGQAIGGSLVFASAAAVCERFVSPASWSRQALKVAPGEILSRNEFIKKLVVRGYKRVPVVEQPGEFSVRGGLLDIFSPGAPLPARLDFFGDEIEVIRCFSPETQRSIERLESLVVLPMLETIVSPDECAVIAEKVEAAIAGFESDTLREVLQNKLERFSEAPDSRDIRDLYAFFASGSGFLWEHWENFTVFIEEHDQVVEELERIQDNQLTAFEKSRGISVLPAPERFYHSADRIQSELAKIPAGRISRFRGNPDQPGRVFSFNSFTSPADPSRQTIANELKAWMEDDWAVALVVESGERFHNLRGLLKERNFPVFSPQEPLSLEYGRIMLINGAGRRGFFCSEARIAVLCEEDVYATLPKAPGKLAAKGARDMLSLSNLVSGDFVVHVDHGIGVFEGVHEMTAGGQVREYLQLRYAGSDKLYVPTDQVHKVQKYIGMEGSRPTVHGLNSRLWESQKRRVRKNVEEIAKELLELYARRHSQPGFAFPPDCDLQMRMEAGFPFVETPDQARAIEAVKQDMESELPMDRLVCGDVGYGKTEVAVRAAFKAVCGGKQVAVLAPTTLLAFQHFQTFSKRLEEFPVRVEMISRLRRPAQQKVIMHRASLGEIDILIGTHRVLSNDIKFKDLGLLVVDEEQRFGVKHKEKLKAIKASLDVLTLTATPIPRTLQMTLSGIRQISVIDTPPEDRLPIQTWVAPFDPAWVKRAIIDEMKRGGQVYYVFNRVERIDAKAVFLRNLVPEARVVVAHGQMDERVVEKTMLSFINREYDVLLATTIIESGLDIPNVNTLVVDEAERLGLSQMYQLRGRVGRSSRQAWAFFFYSKGKRLTKEATERLETIEEHTSLGSGFKIALRDLQIRGAGNILGESQSGHISSIGLSLYLELLEEAVKGLQGVPTERGPETAVEIPVAAMFPRTYMPEEDTRIEFYSRLSRCREVDALQLILAETEDRFGVLPQMAENLFHITRIRIMASKAGIIKVTLTNLPREAWKSAVPDNSGGFNRKAGNRQSEKSQPIAARLRFEFEAASSPNLAVMLDPVRGFSEKIQFNPSDPLAFQLSLNPHEASSPLESTERVIKTVLEG